MNQPDLTQIAIFVAIASLPSLLLIAIARFTPLRALARRNEINRWTVAIVSGLLYLFFVFEVIMWILGAFYYDIAEYYFDISLGTVPGVTRYDTPTYAQDVINELWVRQLPFNGPSTTCFSDQDVVCQLADEAIVVGSPYAHPGSAFFLALIFAGLHLTVIFWLIGPVIQESGAET